MNRVLLAILVVSVVTVSLSLDCSDVVVKEQEGLLSWLGNITFPSPVDANTGWIMDLVFDQNFTFIGTWNATISSNGLERWAEIINNRDETINAGDKKSVRFRIRYGEDQPQPQLVSLRFQDIELCKV